MKRFWDTLKNLDLTRGISQILLHVIKYIFKIFKNPTMFWQFARTYCLNMTISKRKKENPQNLTTLVQFFSHKNPLHDPHQRDHNFFVAKWQ